MRYPTPRSATIVRALHRATRLLPLQLEKLEARNLLTASPIGSVGAFTTTSITGWAYDSDDAAGAENIQITINGSTTTIAANVNRTDLINLLGSPYHGFSFTPPTLPPGASTVVIKAVSPSTGATTVLRSGVLTNSPPRASVVFSDTLIHGWAYDPDSTSPIQLRIDINGVAGTPFTTNVSRPDVTPLSGFADAGFSVAGNFAGEVVEVYAIDVPSNQPVLLWTNNRLPIGSVGVNDGFTVSGWALDPDDPSASINVQVDIDGSPLPGTPTLASNVRNDLIPIYGSADHGFSIAIPGLTPGSHTISVYAIDGQANSAAPVLIGSKVVTDAPPVGSAHITGTTLSGWALDPDLGAAPTTITVYVDDTVFTTITANGSRPDLVPLYGSPNHGFIVDLSSLSDTSHSISVTAADNRTSDEQNVVIFDTFINNHQPIGHIDSIANNTITGWAQDPDTATSPIQVDIYVDGAYNQTTTANLERDDLTATLGSPDHGFSVTLPPLDFGTHTIAAYAAESQGNVSTLIGTWTVTNNRPQGSFHVTDGVITGWAYDPDTATQSITIEVYINGVLTTTTTANIERDDLTPVIGSPDHGFSVTLPTLSSGRNQIDVYAVDTNNNLISILGSSVVTV